MRVYARPGGGKTIIGPKGARIQIVPAGGKVIIGPKGRQIVIGPGARIISGPNGRQIVIGPGGRRIVVGPGGQINWLAPSGQKPAAGKPGRPFVIFGTGERKMIYVRGRQVVLPGRPGGPLSMLAPPCQVQVQAVPSGR